MIKRIELQNFMSHVHTVIEPAPGLTVLVGPNNCGKSAVVAALQILCHNENSTYVLRHGEKECSVKITTGDGHTVEWRRKKSPSYVIDDQVFDRLGRTESPPELHRALRLPYVDGGGDGQFDVHFGEQKSPIFLLDQSAATAARFFASSSDAIRLVQIQRRHKEKHSQRQRDKNRLETESRQLNAELEALLPAVELDEQLKGVERLHGMLVQEVAWLAQAERDQAALVGQHQAVARHEAQSQSLAPLKEPPEQIPTDPLEELTAKIQRAEVERLRSDARLGALAPLPMPPSLADDAGLAAMIDRLHKWAAVADREQSTQRTLVTLAQPPALADTTDLAILIDRLAAAERDSTATAARQATLAGISSPPELCDESGLTGLVNRLAAAERNHVRWAEFASCSAVTAPAMPGDFQPLAECIVQLETTADQANRLTTALKSAAEELVLAEAALREFAASEACPTCGSPLDADRLIAGAAFPGGGHNHG